MTVEQLIELLNKCPNNATVCFYDSDNGTTQVNEVEIRQTLKATGTQQPTIVILT